MRIFKRYALTFKKKDRRHSQCKNVLQETDSYLSNMQGAPCAAKEKLEWQRRGKGGGMF